MTGVDRRQFVVSLTAAVTAMSLAGSCRRLDPSALSDGLDGLFGDRPEWDQLGKFWRDHEGTSGEELLLDLARRLGWRPQMSTEDLTVAILEQMKIDFQEGRIGRPGGWGLAETELAIYAVIGSRQATGSGADKAVESG